MPLRVHMQIVTFLALPLFAVICLGNFPKPWAVFVYSCDWESLQRTSWLEAVNPTWGARFRRAPIKQLNNGTALILQSMLRTSWLWAAGDPQPRLWLLGSRHLGNRINASPLLLRGGQANFPLPVGDEYILGDKGLSSRNLSQDRLQPTRKRITRRQAESI